ncbi:uncharacterized protein LOC111316407 [Durio zibethinus]|uniref:Uncharacterized protein LOC111316407 n=1 Tax=Durio zibethinus TaxID=66656 RepID=A0A6P6BAH8_DURZI|nr:uncharacterized protein LOC111316407 [Durio zibethinus]
MDVLNKDQVQLLTIGAWTVWIGRNNELHERAQEPTQQGWKPPPTGLHKLKFDGAVNVEGKVGGIGVIIRDSKGLVTRTYVSKWPWITEALTIETIAALRALEVAKVMGINEVIMEGDNLTLMNRLNISLQNNSSPGVLIEEICILARQFRSFKAVHTGRKGNEAAHKLARLGLQAQEG